jgi:predicted O-linked N-acetylglucosamine transferase (SPINDLY family)
LTESEAVRIAFTAVGRSEWREAERICRAVLNVNRDSLNALYLLGFVAIQMGKMKEAVDVLSRAVVLAPKNADINNNLGLALAGVHRIEEALAYYDKAIAIKPDFLDAFNNRGNALQDLQRFEEALSNYDSALAIRDDAQLYYNKGNALSSMKRPAEAATNYERALAIAPDQPAIHINLGNALRSLGRNKEAISCYERALSLDPDSTDALNNKGNALLDLHDAARALETYDQALAISPHFADVYANRGNALYALGLVGDALSSYDHALALKKDPGTFVNRGNLLRDCKRLPEALLSYDNALALDPHRDFLPGIRLHTKMSICDWSGFEGDASNLVAQVLRGQKASLPFSLLSITDSMEAQRQAAATWIAWSQRPDSLQQAMLRPPRHNRIKIGYFSADFHDHATSRLMVQLFELHDRKRFEVIGFSFGPATTDAMRTRVIAAFDELIDVRQMSDDDVIAIARAREIDIAIDLKGFTQGNRLGIFAGRAAPIQVNYLGYPGTMAAKFIDYLLADRILIPEAARSAYSEKIAYLPNSYQINDRRRQISDRKFTRDEAGLPERGFVYCCFNSNYKITPDVFSAWMRILESVPHSVLWLLRNAAGVENNLKREAHRRGIDPDRLIFASPAPPGDHLARHHLANLFLDTLPCNAHTTASDALWTGLPLLTCVGASFASRVAASLLNAVDLDELVVSNMDDYVARAIALGSNPDESLEIRNAILGRRLAAPLFDSEQTTRDIERAYTRMYERHCNKLLPDDILTLD